MSDEAFILSSYDKYLFYKKNKNILPLLPTYINKKLLLKSIKKKKMTYPIVAKPRFGSSSLDMHKIYNNDELIALKDGIYIFQENLNMIEYGIDIYIDFISSDLIDVFMKKKIFMRGGETDKSISIWEDEIYVIIEQFISKMEGIKGPIDIDIFFIKGKFYVNEINPRFGGGYAHAHWAGLNFINYIIQNMFGKANKVQHRNVYKKNSLMLKHNDFLFKDL